MRLLLAFAAALPLSAATCDSLASLPIPHATIQTAALVAASGATPAYCRVAGVLKPSPDSDIRFEIWLPETEKWNGKFEGIGNGGFAGSISTSGLTSAVRLGYATASTDTGHRGAGSTDASWALGHPEKVVDFGYRAIHETALAAKAAIAAFYGSGPAKSYFHSCSNGGRQALMEAQRFPEDYDGIIAGAPANYWTPLVANGVYTTQALTAEGAWIPPAKLATIENAALAACDAKDGVQDGVIDSPDRCAFKPSSLLCQGADADTCLTAPQVAALETILGGLRGSKGALFPGYVVGGITGQGGWADWITGREAGKSLMYAFGSNFYANIVYQDRAWDFHTFQPDRDTQKADAVAARILNATDPDLSKFAARGGKLILYHGWSDAAITPLSTIDYYKQLRRPESFVRLYMVPGMQHCGGGPGPNDFGRNIDAAIERWVEQGVAPTHIVAKKGNTTRPVCPYPKVAKYKGTGSPDDAANFTCN